MIIGQDKTTIPISKARFLMINIRSTRRMTKNVITLRIKLLLDWFQVTKIFLINSKAKDNSHPIKIFPAILEFLFLWDEVLRLYKFLNKGLILETKKWKIPSLPIPIHLSTSFSGQLKCIKPTDIFNFILFLIIVMNY